MEGYLDANLLGTNDAFNYGLGLDSSLANSASPSTYSNSATSNLFENGNNQLVPPNSMQQNFISDASVVLPSQAAAKNPVSPDFSSLLGGTNLDSSGSDNTAQGEAFNNQNNSPITNIDNSLQEAARIPSGSDQTGGYSFGNISPDQANSFQYIPDLNVQAPGVWS